jgi:hypothetical protein
MGDKVMSLRGLYAPGPGTNDALVIYCFSFDLSEKDGAF